MKVAYGPVIRYLPDRQTVCFTPFPARIFPATPNLSEEPAS